MKIWRRAWCKSKSSSIIFQNLKLKKKKIWRMAKDREGGGNSGAVREPSNQFDAWEQLQRIGYFLQFILLQIIFKPLNVTLAVVMKRFEGSFALDERLSNRTLYPVNCYSYNSQERRRDLKRCSDTVIDVWLHWWGREKHFPHFGCKDFVDEMLSTS